MRIPPLPMAIAHSPTQTSIIVSFLKSISHHKVHAEIHSNNDRVASYTVVNRSLLGQVVEAFLPLIECVRAV